MTGRGKVRLAVIFFMIKLVGIRSALHSRCQTKDPRHAQFTIYISKENPNGVGSGSW